MINLNEIPSTSDPINDRDHQNQHLGFYQCPLVSSSSSSLGNGTVGFYPPLSYQDNYMDDENCIATKRKKAKQKAPRSSSSSSYDVENDFSSSRWNKRTPIVRVCSDCSTTKTPLWRSGPDGPKTLCNACGIRQRKAMAAVAAHEKPAVPVPASKMKEKKTMKKKRRCKRAVGSSLLEDMDGEKEESLEMVLRKLRKLRKRLGIVDDDGRCDCERLVFHQEEEAAILLMALSSGLQFN